jgi:hypothetical protein
MIRVTPNTARVFTTLAIFPPDPLTIKDIAGLSLTNYRTTSGVVAKLVDECIVTRIETWPSPVFSLNPNAPKRHLAALAKAAAQLNK